MKKAISLLMAGGMMMSLAACGGSAAASSDNAANTTTSTETASTAADSGEKITLHCMMSLASGLITLMNSPRLMRLSIPT